MVVFHARMWYHAMKHHKNHVQGSTLIICGQVLLNAPKNQGIPKFQNHPKIYWGFLTSPKRSNTYPPFPLDQWQILSAVARHVLVISEGAGVVNDHGLAIGRNLRGEPQNKGQHPKSHRRVWAPSNMGPSSYVGL